MIELIENNLAGGRIFLYFIARVTRHPPTRGEATAFKVQWRLMRKSGYLKLFGGFVPSGVRLYLV